ncbi:ABC transporter permease [Solwaraspora sp. WMMB335]|uniref:ABC transporter permease n=1 Tax=Solwaraspora sp. WMMB335 TaxID=3404118 RepID=UPI003B95BC83
MAVTLTSRAPAPVRSWIATLPARFPWVTAASLAVFLLLWEIIGRLADYRALPPVSEIYRTWLSFYQDGVLFTVLLESAKTFGMGIGLAIGTAIVVALLMSLSRTAEQVIAPYIDAGMSVPITATIPILMMVFGLGTATRVAVVFLYSFFIIVVSMQAGLKKVDPAHEQLAHAYAASPMQVIMKITLPSALPLAITGIRLGVSRGIRGMVNAEVIISTAGIGWLLMRSSREFNIAGVWAVTATIIAAALLVMGLVTLLERWFVRGGAR